jgi:hypothetical protein
MPTSEETDLFLMANLTFRLTGLPFVVWISPRGNTRHDVQVKVSPGPRANPDEMISVAIRPEIRVIDGSLSPEHVDLLCRWIELNRDVLIRYWDGDIAFTEDALAALQAIQH